MDRTDALALVYRRFGDAEPELANGFAEHGPMGAEALLTLGIDPAVVVEWAGRHDPEPATESSRWRVTRDAIAAELAAGDWGEVLRRHTDELVGRLDAHLFHGLIRTAHAVRALEWFDSPDTRRELAGGLAAWSRWSGGDDPEVVRDRGADPLAEILERARCGAAAYVATPSIITLHAVTAPMAYLVLADHLDPGSHAIAASVFARTHRRHPTPAPRHDDPVVVTADQLSSLATRWDAHPVKLVEAALRGQAMSGDAVFGVAASTMLAG